MTFSRADRKTEWAPIRVGLHPDCSASLTGRTGYSPPVLGQDRETMGVPNTVFYYVVTSKAQSSKRSLSEWEVLKATVKGLGSEGRVGHSTDVSSRQGTHGPPLSGDGKFGKKAPGWYRLILFLETALLFFIKLTLSSCIKKKKGRREERERERDKEGEGGQILQRIRNKIKVPLVTLDESLETVSPLRVGEAVSCLTRTLGVFIKRERCSRRENMVTSESLLK